MQFFISLIILGFVSVGSIDSHNVAIEKENIAVKESLLLSLERTPCFGMCPTYKYTIFNTGRVIYEGEENVDNVGKYSAQLSKKQIAEIKDQIISDNIFSLKDKYDAKITDIPSTLLIINLEGKKKKIFDRHGAPENLKKFEKFVDAIVLNSKMIKLQDK